MSVWLCRAAVFFGLFSWGCSSSDSAETLSSESHVTLTDGTVAGTEIDGVRAFFAIPYAAPPLAERRWRAPEAPEPWQGTRDASEPGPDCVQLDLLTGKVKKTDTSEDCLHVNVWSPSPAPTTSLPVMVWLHGGGFTGGSGHQAGSYAGEHLVKAGPVVVVTFNYRLGPFGFMAHPDLTAEAGASGNYGIMDQRLALQWVQANVSAFGGDPNNVTVFGESAGGISNCVHLVSPGSQGLFDKVVLQSGPCSVVTNPLALAEQQGADLAEAVGCDDLSCLRAADTNAVLEALPPRHGILFGDGVRWDPTVDGAVIPDEPQALLDAGDFADVPILLGSNKDEGRLFIMLGELDEMDSDRYAEVVADGPISPDQVEAVLAQYPATRYGTPADTLAHVMTQSLFSCPSRRAARAFHAGGSDVFLYHFVYEPDFPLAGLGAFHASELPYVFGHGVFGLSDPTESERPLAEAFMKQWTHFAATGNPNGVLDTTWPKYDETDQHLVMDVELATDSGLLSSECDFWDAL